MLDLNKINAIGLEWLVLSGVAYILHYFKVVDLTLIHPAMPSITLIYFISNLIFFIIGSIKNHFTKFPNKLKKLKIKSKLSK